MKTIFNDNFWAWNNGKYYQSYCGCKDRIEIRCFATKQADMNNGELWINDKLIVTGKELGAESYQEGNFLILEYALNNSLVKN